MFLINIHDLYAGGVVGWDWDDNCFKNCPFVNDRVVFPFGFSDSSADFDARRHISFYAEFLLDAIISFLKYSNFINRLVRRSMYIL